MLHHEAYRSYHAINLDAQTTQASPLQLVLVLMDGLLEELARARAHIDSRRIEMKARSLDKCIEILNGLSSALDVESGGEVAGNLERLYHYCAERLYKAGFMLDVSIVDEVARLLTTIRQGWQGMQEKRA